jgi:hypothetical protein
VRASCPYNYSLHSILIVECAFFFLFLFVFFLITIAVVSIERLLQVDNKIFPQCTQNGSLSSPSCEPFESPRMKMNDALILFGHVCTVIRRIKHIDFTILCRSRINIAQYLHHARFKHEISFTVNTINQTSMSFIVGFSFLSHFG